MGRDSLHDAPLAALVPPLIGVSVIVFLFLHLIPGDPASALLGEHATILGRAATPITNRLVLDSVPRGGWAILGQAIRHLLLPALALSTVPMAIVARMTPAR
jgi:peptide/nickel transport system permease protein